MSAYKSVQTLEILEQASNYNRWISESIKEYISAPVLEIGAGLGNITSFLINNKPFVVTDKDPALVKVLHKKFNKEKNISFEVLDIEKRYKKNRVTFFKSIFSINVLEHIEDDISALKNMKKMLKRDGIVVALVPANRFAYTNLDRELGHFRRYSKEELTRKFSKAGFSDIKIKPFNAVGLLSWIVRDKLWRKNPTLLISQVTMFEKIVPILKHIESIIPVPVGISFIVVARS